MPNDKQKTASNTNEINKLTDIMYKAYWLKNTLDSIPLKIATNTQGGQFVKPDIHNPKLPQIRKEVKSFAEDIKSLPFEIPLFDDGIACSESAIMDKINNGIYNIAALCYNKAVLTIYKEIGSNYSEDMALAVYTETSLMYDRLFYEDEF